FLFRLVVAPLHQMLLLGDGRGMALTDNNGRWLIWQQAAAGIEQAPWLGYGWNQTPSAHAAGVLKFPGPGTFTNAHNVILDLLAWTGIPIGIVLVGTCIYWLVSRASRAARPETICAMAVVMPVFTHSLVEYPFAYGFFLVPVGLLIGFVEARLPAAPVRQVRKQWIWICAAVWSLSGMAVVYEYIQIEEDFRVIRFENMNIGRVPQGYEAPKLHVLTHMGAMLDASRLRPTPGMSNDQLEVLGKISHRFSYGALALRNAIALGLNGNPEAASRQMAVIKAMYGNAYYAAAVSEIRQLQATKYPQLGAVQTP
ncbi:MAG: Wzy polymerase domain-containing protein, partial [Solirubrobacteraceae bacterium]|nr:Wzy polymerase domain-containing protein [Solirubrobacteraceae bacterium]